MRLSNQTILILKETISRYINNPKIILFGSRVDDNKKGGDIDILVETQEDVDLKTEIKILAECEVKGIYRKIDMILKTPFRTNQSIFETAIKDGIVL